MELLERVSCSGSKPSINKLRPDAHKYKLITLIYNHLDLGKYKKEYKDSELVPLNDIFQGNIICTNYEGNVDKRKYYLIKHLKNGDHIYLLNLKNGERYKVVIKNGTNTNPVWKMRLKQIKVYIIDIELYDKPTCKRAICVCHERTNDILYNNVWAFENHSNIVHMRKIFKSILQENELENLDKAERMDKMKQNGLGLVVWMIHIFANDLRFVYTQFNPAGEKEIKPNKSPKYFKK